MNQNNKSSLISYLLLILTLIIVFLLIEKCIHHNRLSKNNQKTIKERIENNSVRIDTIVKYDTIHSTTYVQNWRNTIPIVYFDTIEFVKYVNNSQIDTNNVIKSHFSNSIYTRNFKDSLLNFNLIDTISQNKLLGSAYNYTFATKTISITKSEKSNMLFFGLISTFGLKEQVRYPISFDLIYVPKNKRTFVGAIYNPFSKDIGLIYNYNLLKSK